MPDDEQCNHGGPGDTEKHDRSHRQFEAFVASVREFPAWLIGLLTLAFVAQPVLDCGQAEAYRRLRTLLTLGLIGLLLTLLLTLAANLPVAELLMLL